MVRRSTPIAAENDRGLREFVGAPDRRRVGAGSSPPPCTGPFLEEAAVVAGRTGRPGKPIIACVVLRRGRRPRAVRPLGRRAERRSRFCEPVPVLISADAPLDVSALGNADGLLVCGGLTPGYAAAMAAGRGRRAGLAAARRPALRRASRPARPSRGGRAGRRLAGPAACRSVPMTPPRTSRRSPCGRASAWCRSPSTCTARSGARCRG